MQSTLFGFLGWLGLYCWYFLACVITPVTPPQSYSKVKLSGLDHECPPNQSGMRPLHVPSKTVLAIAFQSSYAADRLRMSLVNLGIIL